jgi:hypothetical protein
MGDKSKRGRGCVSKKYASGGAVSSDPCNSDSIGFFEGGEDYKKRLSNDKKACGNKEKAAGAAVASSGVDRIKEYRNGSALDRRMKEAGL